MNWRRTLLGWKSSFGGSDWGSPCCVKPKLGGVKNTTKQQLFDSKAQQQTRVLKRLTLNLSNFEK
jgi:hypothetical protein